ncbi:hypothetical protein DKX38_022653 [Salix brachista]|uniref:Uncharacterized protein n=1 Tax=Salix brachista TaxID=2182728 RepID=A0A5N5K367_9ROSI|nr:hypothetical protein DKX38_022653 [Salix brachista]
MGLASRAGDWTFKVFTAGLGVATTYLAATFSVNVYRGLSWHNTQSVTTFSSNSMAEQVKLLRCKQEQLKACDSRALVVLLK